jgi:hypothetical protein
MGIRVSVSSRRERVAIYPFVGTNDGGFATPTYGASRGTFFCRVSPVAGEELVIGAQSEHSQRSVFEFADGVTVDENDLLVDADGLQWKVESRTLRKEARAIVCRAFRTDEAAALITA